MIPKAEINYNRFQVKGKFGNKLTVERNLGNNCLMIWGRHIEVENVQEFVDWIDDQWGIKSQKEKDEKIASN